MSVLGIGEHGEHDPQQGVALEDGVGIHHAHVGRGGRIQAGIDGVGLAPAGFFINDHQPGFGFAAVQTAHASAGNLRDIHGMHEAQLERVLQLFQRAVLRPIVDDDHLQLFQLAVLRPIADEDHLQLGVIQVQNIPDRHANGLFFVVRGHQQRDGGHQRRVPEPRQAQRPELELMQGRSLERDQEQHQIDQIAGEVVDKEPMIRPIQNADHGSFTGAGTSAGSVVDRSAASFPVRRTASKTRALKAPRNSCRCNSAVSVFRRPAFSIAAR